jgi:hypothetical protein
MGSKRTGREGAAVLGQREQEDSARGSRRTRPEGAGGLGHLEQKDWAMRTSSGPMGEGRLRQGKQVEWARGSRD